jgi:hypothetical protein
MIYVGYHKTKNLDDNYIGSGKRILSAIKKYGRENFTREILKIFDNSDDAEAYERHIVNEEFTNRDDTYNIALGGNVRAYSGKNNPMYGVRHSPEVISSMRESANKTMTDRGFVRTTPTEYWCTHYTGRIFYTQVELKKFYDVHDKNKLILAMYDDLKNLDFYLPTTIDWLTSEYNRIIEHRKLQKDRVREMTRVRMTGRIVSESERKKRSDSRLGMKNPWTIESNKNPEKIRKTAEKHRGMKRSESAKKNMKAAMLKRSTTNQLNENYSPNNNKFKYATPNGIYLNPYFSKYLNMTGSEIALLCQYGSHGRKLTNTINSKIRNILPEEMYGTLLSDIGFYYVPI